MSTEITTTKSDDRSMPIVIDLGKKSRKRVRKLRKGKPGALMDKVTDVMAQMKEAGAITAAAQPVVIIVRERRRNKMGKMGKMWGLG
jgi:hypothetical protein